mmetsp:Transcript_51411/g.59478  ORF Transcript_51411/g.59478 Transcript_51411/m.59478 type:complete len:97 (-) Transcript_51411:724-1014(-)
MIIRIRIMEDRYAFSKPLSSVGEKQEDNRDEDDNDDAAVAADDDISSTTDASISILSTDGECETVPEFFSLLSPLLLTSLLLQSKILTGSNHSGSA